MKSSDKTAVLIVSGILAWIIGSAAVGGFLHGLSASTWMDLIIIIFVIGLGAALVWIGVQIKPHI
jgi:hypothetical protein